MRTLVEIYAELSKRDLVLELCRKEDEEGLYQIFEEVVEAGTYFPYEESTEKEFRRHFFAQDSAVYVCRSKKYGVLGGFFLKANLPGRSGHIVNAAYMIRHDARGKGLGRLLCEASLHLAKRLGYTAMQYNMVLSQNTRALQLYESLGFEIIGTIPKAVRNLDDTYQSGYIMYRNLSFEPG